MFIRYKSFEVYLEREALPFRFELTRYPTEDGFILLVGGKWRLVFSRV